MHKDRQMQEGDLLHVVRLASPSEEGWAVPSDKSAQCPECWDHNPTRSRNAALGERPVIYNHVHSAENMHKNGDLLQ